MKEFNTFVLIVVSIFGCNQKNSASETVNEQRLKKEVGLTSSVQEIQKPIEDLEVHLKKYQDLKARIGEKQNELRLTPDFDQNRKIELAGKYLSTILIDSIFPYWVGTQWDFNGISEKPLHGEIACGYFVSTTIRDLGVKLNRYKIAQKAASEIIHSLCDPETIITTSSLQKMEDMLERNDEYSVCIVGLDFHVGFIFRKGGKNYFAHSNYINRKGVEIELMADSDALKNSNTYVVGNFSKNKEMITNWLN